MRLFNTLALEITSRCNRACRFCPVAYNTRPDERMDEDLLRKAAGELGGLRYRGRVEFYVYNEPLRDPEYLEFAARLVRRHAPGATLMIATNGDYLRGPEDLAGWHDAGINQILINCYSPGLYARRLPWVQSLSPAVSRTAGVYAATGPRSRTILLLDKSDPDSFGTGVFALINRAGNVPDFLPPTAAPVQRMCVKPFRLLNINWRGEALVCCQDYHGDVAYGSLRDHTLTGLWDHPVMNAYREHLLRKDRSLPLCRSCDCHAGAYPHNVPAPDGPAATDEDVEAVYAAGLARRVTSGARAASGTLAAGGGTKNPRTTGGSRGTVGLPVVD